MGQSQAAGGMDRLPWLADEPAPPAKRGRSDVVALAAGVILFVAAGAYWFGVNNATDQAASPAARSATTVVLPPAQPSEPAQPEVKPDRVPQIEPIVAPPMPVVDAAPRLVRRPLLKSAPAVEPTDEVKDSAQPSPAPVRADPLEPWPVRVIDGASGRLVRIGTFATAHQAKKGWWALIRMNPALQRLPALVVPVRSLRNGQTYYRLQMGTTSPAHSEILCQRMRMIAQSCVVIGLPEPAK